MILVMAKETEMKDKLITLLDLDKINQEICDYEKLNFDFIDDDPEYHEWLNRMSELYDERIF